MKIIQGTGVPRPSTEAQTPPTAHAPEGWPGRLEALEKIVKSILQKLQALEERVEAVEKAPIAPAPVPEAAPVPSLKSPLPSTATLDSDAVKKGLLAKMWKYLNDERPAKAA
jgi:hypothetical protein